MKKKADIVKMRIVVKVINPFCVECAGTADDAMNLIAFFEEEFC